MIPRRSCVLRPPGAPTSRRQFLALGGAVIGGGVLLAACGGSDDTAGGDTAGGDTGGDDTGGDATSATATTDGFVLVQRYPNSMAITPGDVRLAISLADTNASLLTTGPTTLTGIIRNEQGDTIAEFDTPRRGDAMGVPYWSITASIPSRGLYELVVDGAIGDATPFLLFDSSEIAIPTVGTPLPGFDTPTTGDARGVDPVCTRLDGACPFHDVTLTEALALGKPVVYLVGTPAHCQTATCGPGLDYLIDASKQYASVATFVHAEVFADQAGTEVAPAVTALSLDYEPVIWITDADGTVARRVDIVWDSDEISAILAEVLA